MEPVKAHSKFFIVYDEDFSDIDFSVSGVVFKLHKFIIAQRSIFFRDLASGIKPKVPFPSSLSPYVFKLIVEFMYHNEFSCDASRCLFELYEAGIYFGIPGVVKTAESMILNQLTKESAVEIFMKALSVGIDGVVKKRSRQVIVR